MFLAKSDPIAPPDTIRAAFARAGEPKRLVEVEGTHYSPYLEAAAETSRGAVDWFSEHLKGAVALAQRSVRKRTWRQFASG
jgi:hypothetical protein